MADEITLVNSFDKTNLDLESNLEIGGPIGDTLSGFVHKYLPGSKYPSQGELHAESPLMQQYDKTNLDLQNPLPIGGPINDQPNSGFIQKYTSKENSYPGKGELESNSPLMNQYSSSNFDLTDPEVIGGPINDVNSGFEHKYTPENPYYTNNQGTIGNESETRRTTELGVTGLDNTDEEAGTRQGGTGGPNRISPDIPTGEYKNINLLNGETIGGKAIQVQRWSATNPYFESVKGVPEVQDPAPPPSEAPSEEGDVTGTDMSMDPSAVNLPPG